MTQGQKKLPYHKVNFLVLSIKKTAQIFEKKALNYHPIEERREPLQEIADYIRQKLANGKKAQLIFICTHNSRRSHFCALLFELAKDYYNIEDLQIFSGGSKPTYFHENTKTTLEKMGFVFLLKENSKNPKYLVKNLKSANLHFSKNYQDEPNPKQNFAAIVVCSSAEKECPMVFGQDRRIYLPYEDPSFYDNTPEAEEVYFNTSLTIGKEMFWIAQRILH